MYNLLTRWGVSLECCYDTRLGDLIWSAIIHINCRQQENVTLLSDARRYRFHNVPVDGLLVVCNKILIQQLLDLIGGQPMRVSFRLDFIEN